MTTAVTGWIYVGIQAILLLGLVVLPGRSDWKTDGLVGIVGLVFLVGGLAIGALSAIMLGRSLTPTPVPVQHGQLTTAGLYRFVRHPIYTGVLLIVIGLTIRSGSVLTLALAAVTIGFFNHKARWEERRLAERYPEYEAYAEATPRFVPQPWRFSRPK